MENEEVQEKKLYRKRDRSGNRHRWVDKIRGRPSLKEDQDDVRTMFKEFGKLIP